MLHLSDLYGFSTELLDLKGHKDILSTYGSLVLEARMIVTISDGTITPQKRKASLEKLTARVGDFSSIYGIDLKTKILARVMVEGVNKLTNP